MASAREPYSDPCGGVPPDTESIHMRAHTGVREGRAGRGRRVRIPPTSQPLQRRPRAHQDVSQLRGELHALPQVSHRERDARFAVDGAAALHLDLVHVVRGARADPLHPPCQPGGGGAA